MSEESKRKRTPVTILERFKMIAAFLICLVAGFVGLQLLVLTGSFCVFLLTVFAIICFLGLKNVGDEDDKKKNETQDEAYISYADYMARLPSKANHMDLDEKLKHDEESR